MTEADRMTAAEIRRNYNEAKDKPKQIGILADMNDCKRSDIKKILDGTTDELPPLNTKRSYTKPKNPPVRKGAVTNDTRKEIIRLHEQGISGKEIAEKVSCSASFVSTTIKAYKEGNMIFAEEKTAEEREQLAAEITDKLREAPIEVIPREAATRVEELVAMESETVHTLPEGATALDIAEALMNMLREEFANHIIEIRASEKYYCVRVTEKDSGNEINYKKRRSDV